MVFAHKVVRVTFSGTMWGGQEEWSTGLYLGLKDADAPTPTQAAADQCCEAFRSMFVNGNMGISNAYQFTKTKLAAIDASGHTIDSEVLYAAPSGSNSGGNITDRVPSQVALVVTMLSNRPRGLAAKGRMYLPGVSHKVNTSGRIDINPVVNNMAGLLKTFFDSMRNDADIPGQPILAAKGTGALPALTAQNDYITKIRVGDVYDTQRRRRNGLSEAYVNQTLVV